MKTFLILASAAGLLTGCASVDTQPQSSISGEGSLMPGVYDSRHMQTGQFTGRERTNDQIGQRPILPGEADPREIAHREDAVSGFGTGAGSLGQSGVNPYRTVSNETLMESRGDLDLAPAHVAVTPPGSESNPDTTSALGVAPGTQTGTATNNPSPRPLEK